MPSGNGPQGETIRIYNYELIVNEDDDANPDNVRSKQSTLRQFIRIPNAIGGVNKSWFQIPSL